MTIDNNFSLFNCNIRCGDSTAKPNVKLFTINNNNWNRQVQKYIQSPEHDTLRTLFQSFTIFVAIYFSKKKIFVVIYFIKKKKS